MLDPELTLTEALYSALNSEFGIVLRTTDVSRLRQRLYNERAKLKDPDLEHLRFSVSRTNPESELLIVNTKGKQDEI